MTKLTTTDEIIKALGGNRPVALITGRTPKAVSNWRVFPTFPSNTYLALQLALGARGIEAPPELWRMSDAPPLVSVL